MKAITGDVDANHYYVATQNLKLDETEILIYRKDGTEMGYIRHNRVIGKSTIMQLAKNYVIVITALE